MIAKILELSISTNAYIKRFDSRIDKIKKLLENTNNSCYQRNSQQIFDDDFITIFPMKDIDTINDVDIKIKNDPSFEQQMV